MAIHRHRNQTSLDGFPTTSGAAVGLMPRITNTSPFTMGWDTAVVNIDGGVLLARSSATSVSLTGVAGTPKYLYVWSEWQSYASQKTMSFTQHVVTRPTGTTLGEGSTPAASTFYYVYVADNNTDWDRTGSGGTDFRRKIFISTSSPNGEYFFTSGSTNNGNARYLGALYTNTSTQLTGEWSVASYFYTNTRAYLNVLTSNISPTAATWTNVSEHDKNIVLLSGWQAKFLLHNFHASSQAKKLFRLRFLDNTSVLQTQSYRASYGDLDQPSETTDSYVHTATSDSVYRSKIEIYADTTIQTLFAGSEQVVTIYPKRNI